MAEATVGLLRVMLSSNSAQFDAGMDKSSGKVEAFGRAGRSAAQSLGRLVADFNGTKVIAEAEKMAAAIKKVEGVSKLTDEQLGRVNRTLDAAIARYRVMGTEVPPHITKLKNEVAALDKASGTAATSGLSQFSGALSMIGKILPALGVAAVAASLVRLGTAAINDAGKLIDMSNATGLSTDTLQEMQAVANQTSTSLEAFTNTAFKLGVNVAAGSAKARDAIRDLKLEYDVLKAASPDEQFRMVVKALEGVDNAQERNRIGTALFGKQFKEIAAGIEDGYGRIADAAGKSSRAQLEALDKAGDKWASFKTEFTRSYQGMLGTLIQGIQDIERAADSLSIGQKLSLFVRGGGGPGTYLNELKGMGVALRDTEEAQRKTAAATKTATAANTDYIAKLAEVTAEVKGLTATQKAQIDAAAKLGQINDEFADSIGVSREAISLYQSGLKETTKGAREYESATLKAAKANKDFADSIRAIPASNRTAFGNVFTMPRGVEDSSELIGEIRESMDAMASISFDTTWVPFVKGVTASEAGVKRLAVGAQSIAEKYAAVGAQLSSIIVGSAMGGGDMLKSLGAFGGQKLGEKAGELIAKGIGGKLGSVLGGMAGPIGSALGSLAGSAISKLFGGGEGKKVNDLRDGFVKAAGGIHELNVKAQAAGLTLDRLLKAKNVKDYEAAILELNTAFERQGKILAENTAAASGLFDDIMSAGSDGIPAAYRPAIEQLIALGLLTDEQAAKLRGMADATGPGIAKMESAMGTLKGRIESLGPAFRQAKINETAMTYANAIQTLIDGGGDVGGVLFDAREELGELVEESLKSKTTLPANLKPWIDDLVASGNLIDANGVKITDVSQLKFGEPMKTEAEKSKEGWDKIISAIDALIARINGPLTRAIDNLPDEHRIRVGLDDPDGLLEREGYRSPRDNREAGPFGTGTMGRFGKWFGNFGAGMSASVHGMEAILRPKDAVPFSLATLGSMMPSMPSMPSFTPSLAGMGGTTNSTANNMIFVAIPMESAGDTYRITRDVMKALPSSIEMDESGVRSGIERVISDYTRTYGR